MTTPARMSFAAFWQACVRVPDSTGRLVCPVPHREQRRFIEAVDSGQFTELFLLWAKKVGKSFTVAARAAHHLLCDPWVTGERLIGVASSDEEQSRIVYRQVQQIIERQPVLASRVTIGRTEMTYTEPMVDPGTGRPYERTHRLRALPRDVRGEHGQPWTMLVRDELWSEIDQSFSEALILDPTQPGGQILYCSYFAPAVMMRQGQPFYDLLQRCEGL